MVVHNSMLLIRSICFNHEMKKSFSYRKCICAIKRHYSDEKLPIHDTPVENIRNFSIIAHVDHGKSTLADRLLEMTGAIKTNTGKQVLDNLQVEKERGITVKAQTASLNYAYNGKKYLLNLIDTPGHVDFSAEVYRSLAPCQGVVLVVDANDGVQAQTAANYYLACEKNLVIIPVINKIDLKNANPERVVKELNSLFNIDPSTVVKISAKLGTNCDNVLKAVVERIPPPPVDRKKPFRALIFDSWFHPHKGAVSLIYVKEGSLRVKDPITSFHTKKSYEVKNIALLRPHEENVTTLFAGQVGSLYCHMKTSKESHIGDTLHIKNILVEPLTGMKEPKPMVFAGIYPVEPAHYILLQKAIEKLTLNDNVVTVDNDSSISLGQGWRLGFLGLLHMEVFSQRLEQEYNAESIITTPTVPYKVMVKGTKQIKQYKGDTLIVRNPAHLPDEQTIVEISEPTVIGTVITPSTYVSEIMKLCTEKRGVEQESQNIDNDRVLMKWLLPLNEIIHDFHDSLKFISSGYASFDYEDNGYQISDIVKLRLFFNDVVVEEFSSLVHKSKAKEIAKRLCNKLADIIPRQMFLIVIQAKLHGTVLARSEIKPFRKDVTAKLYGGDITRRRKLLAQQAEGKKKMRMIGKVSIPRETFITILKK